MLRSTRDVQELGKHSREMVLSQTEWLKLLPHCLEPRGGDQATTESLGLPSRADGVFQHLVAEV